jgi:hypothetical protein
MENYLLLKDQQPAERTPDADVYLSQFAPD